MLVIDSASIIAFTSLSSLNHDRFSASMAIFLPIPFSAITSLSSPLRIHFPRQRKPNRLKQDKKTLNNKIQLKR